MRNILVNLLRLGGMQLVIAATAIVRNKVLAVRLGPDGFGEFMQISLIVLTASTIAAFGLGMSLNRNVAAARTHGERQRLLAQANSVNVILAALLTAALVAMLSAGPRLLEVFGLSADARIVLALSMLLIFVPLEAGVQHRVAFLTALMDIKGMTAGRSAALALGTAASIPVVWWFGLAGAAAQLTIITLTIVLFLDRRCRALGYRPWALTFDSRVLRTLATYGVASLIAGFTLQLSDVIVRATLIRSTGLDQNGIYQAALSITHQVKAIVLSSVGSYAIASLSQNTTREHVVETANQLLTVVLPVAALALGMLGLLSGPALYVLYSAEFYDAQRVLPWLLSADFVHVAIWVVGAPMLAMRRVGTWLILELIFLGTRMAAALLLLPVAGLVGVAAGHAIATLVHLLFKGGYYLLVFRFTVSKRNLLLFIAGVAVVVIASWAGSRVTFDLTTYVVGTLGMAALGLLYVQLMFGLDTAWRGLRGVPNGGGEK